MLSQDESVNNKLLTLLNGIRTREPKSKPVIPVKTLVHVDKSHKKFATFWICVMILLFVLVGFAGTRFWPSLFAMRIFEYLFTTSVHIFFLFGLFRSIIPGEFEKPIQYTLLIAVPVASALNVLIRLNVSDWSPSAPTYFGHALMSGTRDWLYGVGDLTMLHYGYFISLIVLFTIIWLHSKVRLPNLITSLFFYVFTSQIIVVAMNRILAILSRLTTDSMLWWG